MEKNQRMEQCEGEWEIWQIDGTIDDGDMRVVEARLITDDC